MIDLKQISPKKILVINTFGIGDVLFTTPFISNLKASFPEAMIGYVGNKRTAPLLKNNPKITKVFVYERDEFNALYKRSKREFYGKIFSFLKEVRDHGFDVVFDFSLNRNINFLTWLIGIKHRIGFNYRNRSPLLTCGFKLSGFEQKHVVEYYLDILTYLGLKVYERELEMAINEADHQWAESFLKNQIVGKGQPLIGIIPGAGVSWGKEARYRRWSSQKYTKLIDNLIEKFSAKIILMGAKEEQELCSEVISQSGADIIDACGKTNLGQLAALLKKCHLVVLNDGGPLHVSVAVKTKTVSIFGPVDERVYGPYGDPAEHLSAKKNLACQPCYRRFRMTNCQHISCLNTLEVEDVFRQVEKLMLKN